MTSAGLSFALAPNVAIHLRDGDAAVTAHAAVRRTRLDTMLPTIPTLAAIPTYAFDDVAADACGAIVAHAGCSRRKLLDRMIAAQALVHRAVLVTMNSGDFSDVAGLQLLAW